jgi:hypothetical protein
MNMLTLIEATNFMETVNEGFQSEQLNAVIGNICIYKICMGNSSGLCQYPITFLSSSYFKQQL